MIFRRPPSSVDISAAVSVFKGTNRATELPHFIHLIEDGEFDSGELALSQMKVLLEKGKLLCDSDSKMLMLRGKVNALYWQYFLEVLGCQQFRNIALKPKVH